MNWVWSCTSVPHEFLLQVWRGRAGQSLWWRASAGHAVCPCGGIVLGVNLGTKRSGGQVNLSPVSPMLAHCLLPRSLPPKFLNNVAASQEIINNVFCLIKYQKHLLHPKKLTTRSAASREINKIQLLSLANCVCLSLVHNLALYTLCHFGQLKTRP